MGSIVQTATSVKGQVTPPPLWSDEEEILGEKRKKEL